MNVLLAVGLCGGVALHKQYCRSELFATSNVLITQNSQNGCKYTIFFSNLQDFCQKKHFFLQLFEFADFIGRLFVRWDDISK